MQIGFCGLGQMGFPMACRLIDAGHEVWAWNRTSSRAEALGEAGAKVAASPAEAASSAEAIVTMVSSPDALDSILWGSQGVAEGLRSGSALVEMSTVGPAPVKELAHRLPNIDVMDAPVLGSVPQAENGELKIFAGGSEATWDRMKEVLEPMGTPIYMGPLGSGAAVKLVANSMLGAVMASLGEALALADALELDAAKVLDVLQASPLGAVVANKRANLESATYPPSFKLSLARKDMDLVVHAAERAGLDPRVGRAAEEWMEEGDESGLGDLDYSAVVAQVRGAPASVD